jgi:hypothetical protein
VPKQTWAERFLNSLASEGEEDDSRLRDIVQWGDSPRTEDDNLFLAGWNTLAHEYSSKAFHHLESLMEAAESPIEKALLLAICVSAHEAASNIRYKKGGKEGTGSRRNRVNALPYRTRVLASWHVPSAAPTTCSSKPPRRLTRGMQRLKLPRPVAV